MRGQFTFAQGGKQVTVWYYQPAAATAAAPVVFVMHGLRRNGEDYLNDWVGAADEKNFLLVVPEFSSEQFPGDDGYILGNMLDAAGRPRPAEQWSFNMIEPIFDAVRARLGNSASTYRIYGHSAGAQFVHRFLYFVPEARATRAIAANAGWYTLPDLARDFPLGLKGTSIGEAGLRAALEKPLVVLLGDADVDPRHPSLRRAPEVDEQGLHRFARGQNFFALAQSAATKRHLASPWSLVTAPGVAHSNKDMAPFAARLLFPD